LRFAADGIHAIQALAASLRVEALEVGLGDLQAIKQGGGGPVVNQFVHDRLKNLVESELEAGGVLDDGENEIAIATGGGVVKAAEVAAVAGGSAAGQAVDLEMAAARGMVSVVSWLPDMGDGPFRVMEEEDENGIPW
jgi:hypothetical protein